MQKVICVHNGKYHWDDCLAVALVRYIPGYENCNIIRTRDEKIMKTCDLRVDVGNEYDHEKLTYDHHQRGFSEYFNEESKNAKIPMCGASLIYRHYGKNILIRIIKEECKSDISEEDTEWLYNYIYNKYIKSVEGNDNGVNETIIEPTPENDIYKVKKVYSVPGDIVSRIYRFTPSWRVMEEMRAVMTPEQVEEKEMEAFLKASNLAKEEFVLFVKDIFSNTLYARQLTFAKFTTYLKKESRIIALDEKIAFPFISSLKELEKKLGCTYEGNGKIEDARNSKAPLLIISKGSSSDYRINTISVSEGGFVARLFLHPDWRGLRGEELEKASGIKGASFVHISGFLGIATTFDAACEMAYKTLDYYNIEY